jgi:hypothetical protein
MVEQIMLGFTVIVGLLVGLGIVITVDAHSHPDKYKQGMGLGTAIRQAFRLQ